METGEMLQDVCACDDPDADLLRVSVSAFVNCRFICTRGEIASLVTLNPTDITDPPGPQSAVPQCSRLYRTSHNFRGELGRRAGFDCSR